MRKLGIVAAACALFTLTASAEPTPQDTNLTITSGKMVTTVQWPYMKPSAKAAPVMRSDRIEVGTDKTMVLTGKVLIQFGEAGQQMLRVTADKAVIQTPAGSSTITVTGNAVIEAQRPGEQALRIATESALIETGSKVPQSPTPVK
jgi:hypothetical protein